MYTMISLAGLIALIVVLVVIGPVLAIWSLNTLFPSLAIAYTVETWVAMVVLLLIFKPSINYKKG